MMRRFRLIPEPGGEDRANFYPSINKMVRKANPYSTCVGHLDTETVGVPWVYEVECPREPLALPGAFHWEDITPEPKPSPRQLRIRRILKGFEDMRLKHPAGRIPKRAQRIRKWKWVVEWDGKGAGELSSPNFKSAAGTAAELVMQGWKNVVVRPVEVDLTAEGQIAWTAK